MTRARLGLLALPLAGVLAFSVPAFAGNEDSVTTKTISTQPQYNYDGDSADDEGDEGDDFIYVLSEQAQGQAPHGSATTDEGKTLSKGEEAKTDAKAAAKTDTKADAKSLAKSGAKAKTPKKIAAGSL